MLSFVPVDTTSFQLGVPPDDDPIDEGARIDALREDAWEALELMRWTPPVRDLLLAFGVGSVIGLFLVQFADEIEDGLPGENEMWLVVGDVPTIYFETDEAPTPAAALEVYCQLAENWADHILNRGDMANCFPIKADPTEEHARMLKSRVTSIREMFVPIAGATDRIALIDRRPHAPQS